MKFPQAFTVLIASLAATGVNARGNHSAKADLAKKQSGALIDPADLQGSMANIKPAIPLPGKPGWNIAADRLVTIPPQRDGSILIKGSGGNGNDLPKVVGPAGDITKLDFGGSSILINDYDTNTTSVGGYDSAVNLPPYGDIACVVQGGATACELDVITASAASTSAGSSAATTQSTATAGSSTETTQSTTQGSASSTLSSASGDPAYRPTSGTISTATLLTSRTTTVGAASSAAVTTQSKSGVAGGLEPPWPVQKAAGFIVGTADLVFAAGEGAVKAASSGVGKAAGYLATLAGSYASGANKLGTEHDVSVAPKGRAQIDVGESVDPASAFLVKLEPSKANASFARSGEGEGAKGTGVLRIRSREDNTVDSLVANKSGDARSAGASKANSTLSVIKQAGNDRAAAVKTGWVQGH